MLKSIKAILMGFPLCQDLHGSTQIDNDFTYTLVDLSNWLDSVPTNKWVTLWLLCWCVTAHWYWILIQVLQLNMYVCSSCRAFWQQKWNQNPTKTSHNNFMCSLPNSVSGHNLWKTGQRTWAVHFRMTAFQFPTFDDLKLS